ncbi:MFS transporter [Nocardioides jiangxiensis]|uniref:MFS transporter n=1 Tax=Nocardioides jiangxiensis TaxID=3064524 RepID=A0ABT9B227_9ACTN|nr:MFS transporter [Nocardioides sp. WY-20]MDO7868364.1 MFS transporter [Nocardioides sp. WY-20]
MTATTSDLTAARSRGAVMVAFFLNGFAFASWASRIPDTRSALGLGNGELGLLLLSIAVGSVLTLPSSGALITRWGAAAVLRCGVTIGLVGLTTAACAVDVLASVPLTVVGLMAYGLGSGSWDVAMNVEAAAVEHRLARAIMPRFHAGFSLGTVAGAGAGAAATALGVPVAWHLGLTALVGLVLVLLTVDRFLPRAVEAAETASTASTLAAWREPRTLLIGLMIFACGISEGSANDWLALGLIDGYAAPHWLGVAGFGLFVACMTVTRVLGTVLLDRFGRVAVLTCTTVLAAMGVAVVGAGSHPAAAVAGVVLWGVGAALGFPVGLSAAADDPARAAARVSVASTIAYSAFLAGPPLLGLLAEHVGPQQALLAVAALLAPSTLLVGATRPLAAGRDARTA